MFAQHDLTHAGCTKRDISHVVVILGSLRWEGGKTNGRRAVFLLIKIPLTN